MCLGAMSGGVRGARWTQIGAIARADMAWRHLEWRLTCQMNCRKGGQRPCTAVCGSSASFRQSIARADVPWSDVWRGSRCSMDTDRCHRASGYALEAPRMAIAVPDDILESVGPGADGCVWQFGELPANHRASRCTLQARRMAIAVPDEICRKRGQRTITICGNGENRCTGGLAPIIKVRISGPPGSGTLRRDGVGTCSDETKPNLPLPAQKLCPQNRGFSWTKVHLKRFCPQNRGFSWTKSSQPESVI